MVRRAILYAHTLRHARPWQVAGRLIARTRHRLKLTRLPSVPGRISGAGLHPTAPFPAHDPWNDRSALLTGRFSFLNRSEELGRPVNWHPPAPLLWRFNLHYFHYLHLLEPEEQVALCREWVRANRPGSAVAWHPYPTALRIVNWCRAGVEDPVLLQSLYSQAAWLYRNLETYVYGNHLLENARALVLAGRYFEGTGEADRWLQRGLDIYRRETTEQILPDGGHFERSPMYHALMLEGYVDVLNVLPEGHPDASWLSDIVRRMTGVLEAVTHSGGHLALFNDSTREIALPPARLREYAVSVAGAPEVAPAAMPDFGYYVHRSDSVYLIVDAGPAGPDYLMAHAHADALSYELSLAGVQMIVDSGVFEYLPGEMRAHVRSTPAHNTVSVDGRDQIECWGSFRVARRSAVADVSFSSSESAFDLSATFGGYARLLGDGIHHTRRIQVDEAAREIRVDDLVTGGGGHEVASRIHFHPDAEISERDGLLEVTRQGVRCTVRVELGSISWEDGWYCPSFGMRRRNRVAVIGATARLPVSLRYVIGF